MINDPVAVFFILALVISLSIWLTDKYSIFQKIGVALLSIFIAMLLSNIGFLPGNSPAYDFLRGSGVYAAVILILLSVDLSTIKRAGPSMLKAFSIGAVGSTIGAIIMAFLLFPALGAEAWKLSGQFAATYIGGGMNFAAIGIAVGTSSNIFTAALAADVVLASAWMLACLTILALKKPTKREEALTNTDDSRSVDKFSLERSLYNSGKPVPLIHITILAAITFGAIYFSQLLASWLTFFPTVLWLTTIVIILGQVPAVKKLYGSALFGNYFLLLFLASNGARSIIKNIISVGPAVFYFALGALIIHAIIIFSIGRLMRIDLGTIAIASSANVGGPTSALVLASVGKGRYVDRLLPGLIAGLLGYGVGNYVGLGVANLMKNIL